MGVSFNKVIPLTAADTDTSLCGFKYAPGTKNCHKESQTLCARTVIPSTVYKKTSSQEYKKRKTYYFKYFHINNNYLEKNKVTINSIVSLSLSAHGPFFKILLKTDHTHAVLL